MVFNLNPLEQLETDLRAYYAGQPTTGSDPHVENLTQLNSGWASDVYAFTLRYDEAGETVRQNLILKAYANNVDGKDRALKERHALFKLRADHYPVPGVAAVEIDDVHIGRPFIIMEQVNGRLMWEAFQAADDTQRKELIRLFVGLLVDLHALGAGILTPNIKIGGEFTLINREIYTLRGLVTTYGRDEFLPLVEWLYERRKGAPCHTPVVTHRDYHPWNVMLTDQGRPFVIDWGWQISDPRFDLAWTLTLMARSGYPEFRDQMLAEYERVTGGSVDELDYFEVLANTRWLLDVTNSLLFGINLREGSQVEFRAVIADWVRHAAAAITAKTGITLPVEQWL
jgi:aminoglycoside phosphotransferase (APT) family kinase protein